MTENNVIRSAGFVPQTAVESTAKNAVCIVFEYIIFNQNRTGGIGENPVSAARTEEIVPHRQCGTPRYIFYSIFSNGHFRQIIGQNKSDIGVVQASDRCNRIFRNRTKRFSGGKENPVTRKESFKSPGLTMHEPHENGFGRIVGFDHTQICSVYIDKIVMCA